MDSPQPHSRQWYEQLAEIQNGYYYPWKSELDAENGEDFFLEYLTRHIRPEHLVLDVGCGHGGLTNAMAAGCAAIVGYDRVQAFIDLARKHAARKGIENATFIAADSRMSRAGRDNVRIPVDDMRFDVIYSRRGPTEVMETVLEKIFRDFSVNGRVALAQRRFVWESIVN